MHTELAGFATDDLWMIRPEFESSNGRVYTMVDYNRSSDRIALANAASLLIANIASIKDHLKVWCKKQNVPFHGDALINSDKTGALVHDLSNTDKHAQPRANEDSQ